METATRPARLGLTAGRLGAAALTFALGALFAGACRALGPWKAGLEPLNSDCAVPLLMAQHPQHGLFGLFYWGQDRFGAWPFWLAHGVARLTGTTPTFEGLHLEMVVLAALAIGAFALAFGRARALVATALALSLIVSARVRYDVFNLSQPYLWQLAALLPAWAALYGRRASGWAVACTFAFSTLAQLMSPVSGVLLLTLLGLEALWARGKGQWRWLAAHAGAVGVAIATEARLRAAFHLAALARFHDQLRTELHVDRGHLVENARQIAAMLARGDSAPLSAAGVVLAIAAALWRARARDAEPDVDTFAYLTIATALLA